MEHDETTGADQVPDDNQEGKDQGPAMDPALADFAEGDLQAGDSEGKPEKPEASRAELLTPLTTKAWQGGCAVSVWLSEVPQLAASPQEAQLAGTHLAIILDVIMPEDWLTDLDPNSKAGKLLISGAILAALVKQKHDIYTAVKAQQEQQEALGNGDQPEPQPGE